jgi:hypothetical protein
MTHNLPILSLKMELPSMDALGFLYCWLEMRIVAMLEAWIIEQYC